jgi:hypothetical protein
MPRKPSASRSAPKRQVNVRLASETVEILEALMFLEGQGSLQEVVAPLVERYAAERSGEPPVREMLERRARYQASLWEGDHTTT